MDRSGEIEIDSDYQTHIQGLIDPSLSGIERGQLLVDSIAKIDSAKFEARRLHYKVQNTEDAIKAFTRNPQNGEIRFSRVALPPSYQLEHLGKLSLENIIANDDANKADWKATLMHALLSDTIENHLLKTPLRIETLVEGSKPFGTVTNPTDVIEGTILGVSNSYHILEIDHKNGSLEHGADRITLARIIDHKSQPIVRVEFLN